LSGIVVGGFLISMAGDTIGRVDSRVVETGRHPSIGIMTDGTLALEVVGRFIFGVAGCAVDRAGDEMVKIRRQPGGGAVTGRTLSSKMIGGFVLAVTGDAANAGDRAVIEVDIPPGFSRMAQLAVAFEMADGSIVHVAAFAQTGCAPVLAIDVAVGAFYPGMRSGEREKRVQRPQAAGWEGHRGRPQQQLGD